MNEEDCENVQIATEPELRADDEHTSNVSISNIFK